MSSPRFNIHTFGHATKKVLLAPMAMAFANSGVLSGLTVNSALPITNEVTVQPIRVQSSDGSYSAPMFSGPSGDWSWYITQQVDVILAQSGITVKWLTPVDYADDFTLNGHPGNYTASRRPTNHLYTVRDNTPSPPKHPDPLVLNMFFVDIVPGFSEIGDWSVAGIAVVDANGIMITVGDNLLQYPNVPNLDTIAGVVAHEIGHNLGLDHEPLNADNLMAIGWTQDEYVSEKLVPAQTTLMFTNHFGDDGFEFLAPYVPPTQYSLWADAYGLTGGPGDDDDGDQLANVLEFMLTLDPTIPDNHAMPDPVWDSAGLTWTIGKQADALGDGLSYAVEVSADGATWVPAGSASSGSTIVTDSDSVLIVRLDAGSGPNFMRLAVDLSVPLLPGYRESEPKKASDEALAPALPRISGCSPDGCGHRHGHP